MTEFFDRLSTWLDPHVLGEIAVTWSGRLAAEPRIAQHPETEVAVQDVLPTVVTIAVRAWVASADYGNVRSDLLERIQRALDKYGLKIPVEQRALPATTLALTK